MIMSNIDGVTSRISTYEEAANKDVRNIHAGEDRLTRGRNTKTSIDLATQNNFDLIRLFAATQVMVGHVLWYVGRYDGRLATLLDIIPGVPIFFFTSGFLISGTYERNPNLRDFAVNRALRIFPALWASALLSSLLIVILDRKAAGFPLLIWTMMQSSIAQDWNPSFLRDYGIGVANGSLWTIPVELCFYAMTPVLYMIHKRSLDRFLMFITVVSLMTLQILMLFPANSFVHKAGLLTPLPWIGMFTTGILARRYLSRLRPLVEDKIILWSLIVIITTISGTYINAPGLFRYGVNAVGILQFFAIAGLVLSAACSKPYQANRLLNHNDISYGIYILHMPILNALIAAGYRSMVASIGLTLVVSCMSWLLIEKRALSFKRRPEKSNQI